MKKKIFLAILVVSVASFACKKTSQKKSETTETVEVVAVEDMHNAENSLDYFGVYNGVLPVAESSDVDVTITLTPDNKFTKKTVSQGKENATYDDKGNFDLKENLLGLYFENGNIEYYMVGEGHIRMLDKEKNRIEGDLEDQYVLKQTKVFE